MKATNDGFRTGQGLRALIPHAVKTVCGVTAPVAVGEPGRSGRVGQSE